jgi:hypothetical protein
MFLAWSSALPLRAYGGAVGTPARYYVPAYATTGDELWNYDAKLWRAYGHRIAYLTPTTGWSAYIDVGTADAPILNTAVAFGRIYFGKRDSLWCYEGGRVYEVEPFYADASDDNFTLMHASHGAIYFNIRNKLYRYTGAGNIELLFSYPYKAVLGPATTAQEKLYFSVRDESHCGSLYAYDFKTHGFFRELDLQSEAARHTVHDVVHIAGLGVAANKLWMAPFESTSLGGAGVSSVFDDITDWVGDRIFLAGPDEDTPTRAATRATCTATGWLLGLRFSLERWPGHTLDLEFCIYGDDGGSPGKPTGAPLASVTVPYSDIPTTRAWVTGVFSSRYEVTNGTIYHLVVQTASDARHTGGPLAYYVFPDITTDSGSVWFTAAWETSDKRPLFQHLFDVTLPTPRGTHITRLPATRAESRPKAYARQFGGFIRVITTWLSLGYSGLKKYVNEVSVETMIEGAGARLEVGVALDGSEGVAVKGVIQEYSAGNYKDHSANLTDGNVDTHVDFEWGTFASQEALFSHAGQYLYICGAERFDTIVWKLRSATWHSREFSDPTTALLAEVWTGTEWRSVQLREDTTCVGNWVFARTGQWSIRPPRQWEERTLEGYTGYFLRVYNAAPNTARENNQRCYELNLVATSVELQAFTSLGSVTTVGDALTTLAVQQLATRVALRFDFIGSREASAFLKSFKLSFNPVGEGKKEIRVVIKAWDEIKRLDGVIENSALYIVEAIQSLSDAGILYTVGLPYPQTHSIKAQVQIADSFLVPLLVYHSAIDKPETVARADVPIRIIEG